MSELSLPLRWGARTVLDAIRYLRTHLGHLVLAPVMALTGVTFLHELAHAIAVWAMGGTVLEFAFVPSASDFGHVRYSFPAGTYYIPELVAAAPYLMWAGLAGLALLISFLPWRLPRWAGSTLFVWFYVVPILDIVMHAGEWMLGMQNDWRAALGAPHPATVAVFATLCLVSFPVSYVVHRGLYKRAALSVSSYLLVCGVASGALLSGAVAVEVIRGGLL